MLAFEITNQGLSIPDPSAYSVYDYLFPDFLSFSSILLRSVMSHEIPIKPIILSSLYNKDKEFLNVENYGKSKTWKVLNTATYYLSNIMDL